MKVIKCKRIGCGAKKGKGCTSCGGYGHIFQKQKCTTCARFGWFRPHPLTVYVGKRYSSVDGLQMVVIDGVKIVCLECFKKGGLIAALAR